MAAFSRNPIRSWVLVVLQALSLLYLAVSAPVISHRADYQIWQLSGLFISISGLLGLSWHSFSVFPEPKKTGRFISSGIYRFIRHPMYAGILIISFVLVWEYYSIWRLATWIILGFVFVLKIQREEQLLEASFPEYEAYKQNTNRLIPFIW